MSIIPAVEPPVCLQLASDQPERVPVKVNHSTIPLGERCKVVPVSADDSRP